MVEVFPPTSYLPPIKQISSRDFSTINASIGFLRSIYNPEVRGSRRRDRVQNRDLTRVYAITPGQTDVLHDLRTDSFERAYAIKWLTALIARLDNDDSTTTTTQEKEQIIHNAASLLAVCSGSSAAGTIIRDFAFDRRPLRGGRPGPRIPITVTLIDNSLDNDDFRSVGAQTWGSACVLSEMVVEDPGRFSLSADQLNARGRAGTFRILELGAGTGLVSLTVKKLLEEVDLGGSHRVEIFATDYYPSVLENLRANINRNVREESGSPVTIFTEFLDWSCFDLDSAGDSPLHEPFDLVFGADVIYEPEHTKWIHSCVIQLLRKPSPLQPNYTDSEDSFFHVVIPFRSTHSFESTGVEKIFTADINSPLPSLQIVAKDALTCDTETGEEVEYAYYKIGWVKRQD